MIYKHACALGGEGIVSKRLGSLHFKADRFGPCRNVRPIRANGQLTAEYWGPLCRAPEEESQKSEGNGNSHHKPKESTNPRHHKPKESTNPRYHQPISPHSPNGIQ